MTQIDELVIRIPGIENERPGRLGNDVAQLLADAMPEGMEAHRIPELKIRMTTSQLNGSDSAASSIAEQIIKQISRFYD